MFKKVGLKTFLYIDIDRDIKNTVFLAGTGRAGTTWLSELINYDSQYRYMFEPFLPRHLIFYRNFKARQYLRPESDNDYFFNLSNKILSGAIRNVWIDRFNKKFICRERLIKDIRANLFLKWLHNNYPCMPIIFMMRHPCAVALSRLKLNWGMSLNELVEQHELVEDFLSGCINSIKRCKDRFEGYIYLWCVENYVPLMHFRNGEIHVVFYENLCCNPEEELKKIFSWIKKPFMYDVTNKVSLPSKMVKNHSAILHNEDLICKWKKELSKEQIGNASKILEIFGLDQVYDSGIMPKVDNPLPLFK